MAKFVNISGETLSVFAPPGSPGALEVAPGQVLEAVGDADDVGDAYLVRGKRGDRLYPKSTWQLKSGKADAEPDKKEKV